MPIFKGFEQQNDTIVAVVDFPDARRHSPYFDEHGIPRNRITPFPHEERLSEESFRSKFFGMGFEPLKDLPFNEQGHDLEPLLTQHRLGAGPDHNPVTPGIKPRNSF